MGRDDRSSCNIRRDLKLDNTLLDDNKPQRIKLCDFGFAKSWDNLNRNMFTHIGCGSCPNAPGSDEGMNP